MKNKAAFLFLFLGCGPDPLPAGACEVAGWCGYVCGEMAADAFDTAGGFGQAEAQACRAECIEDVKTTGATTAQAESLIDGVGVTCNYAATQREPGACELAIWRCEDG